MIVNRFIAQTAKAKLRISKIRSFTIMGQIINYCLFQQRRDSLFKNKAVTADVVADVVDKADISLKQRIIAAKQINELKTIQQSIFTEDRVLLPLFLCKITKMMNSLYYSRDQQFFRQIQYRLNKTSSELLLKPNELLQVISFQYSFKILEESDTAPNKNGFEHRATMIASNYLLNRQFTLTQAVAIMAMLNKLGTVSLTFYMNFSTFLKTQLRQQSQQKVKIQHLVTILNIHYEKRNHTVMQNILFDLTFNYLLNNYEYLSVGINFILKVQILRILVLSDLRVSYLSSISIRNKLVKSLVDQIISKLNDQNLFQRLLEDHSNRQILFCQVMHLLQCFKFMKDNKLSNWSIDMQIRRFQLSIYGSFQKILKNSYEILSSFFTNSKNKQYNILLVDFLFDGEIISEWMLVAQKRKQILKLTLQQNLGQPNQYIPIINTYLHLPLTKNIIKKELLQIIVLAYYEISANTVYFWVTSQILLTDLAFDRAVNIIQSRIRNILSIKNTPLNLQLEFHLNLILNALKNQYVSNKKYITQQINQWFKSSLQKVSILKRDKTKLLKLVTQKQLLNNAYINQFYLYLLKQSSSLDSIHTNQEQRSEFRLMLLKFVFRGMCSKNKQVSQQFISLFKKIKIQQHHLYKFLINLYPTDYPKINQVDNKLRLSNLYNFIVEVNAIVQHFNIQKYYYLIWDIFIKNYIVAQIQIRMQSFTLLKDIFMRAYLRQSARKVVLFANLTNYMSDGLLIAAKNDLQIFCELIIMDLVQSQDLTFHYNCFQAIIFNLLSCDLLSWSILERVISFQTKCNNSRLHIISPLMLVYGYILRQNKSQNSILSSQDLRLQHEYVSYSMLSNLNTKKIQKIDKIKKVQAKYNTDFTKEKSTKIERLLSILFMSGVKNILKHQIQEFEYIENCFQFSHFMLLLHSYKPEIQCQAGQDVKVLIRKLKDIFLNKIVFFKAQGMISEKDQHILRNKLI